MILPKYQGGVFSPTEHFNVSLDETILPQQNTEDSKFNRKLEHRHIEEWRASGISDDLTELNLRSLSGKEALERLFISPSITRTNSGKVSEKYLRRYASVERDGGWWFEGVDPLDNSFSPMEWGTLKPNTPRNDSCDPDKKIKYEHPPETNLRAFFPQVTQRVWEKVSERYNISIDQDSFWKWVPAHREIPIIITEGVKKAASLLSAGYVAIGLPGIYSGYRKLQENGRDKRQLIPELQILEDRQVLICFDFEEKVKTRTNVAHVTCILGRLLEDRANEVKVICLPGLEKGVDDFLVARGEISLDELISNSISLTSYRLRNPIPSLNYPIAVKLSSKTELETLQYPQSGLAFTKAPKGSGKSRSLIPLVSDAIREGRPVILLSHRVQLGKNLCSILGLTWIDEDDDFVEAVGRRFVGLCPDSLWKLNPSDYEGGIFIIDEIEQVTWHWLGGETCRKKRSSILLKIKEFLNSMLLSSGLIIGLDADLSDKTVDYLIALTGDDCKPWIALLDKQEQKLNQKAIIYKDKNPCKLLARIEKGLQRDEKQSIFCDTREGVYSAKGLFERLKKQFPDKKILLIDAETSRESGHPAVCFAENINEKVIHWDVIICSPSIGSGVSIEVEHFDIVFGFFRGVIPDWEARQALARVRSGVPRHVWVASRGIGFVSGTGRKTRHREIIRLMQNNAKANAIRAELITAKEDDWLEGKHDPSHLICYVKCAEGINASISQYRESLIAGLISEGFTCEDNELPDEQPENESLTGEIEQDLKESSKERKSARYEAIESAPNLSDEQFEKSKARKVKTKESMNAETKYILNQLYEVPVDKELAEKHEKKHYHSKLLLLFFILHDPELKKFRDRREVLKQLEFGDGAYIPDLRNITLKVELLQALGVMEWLPQSLPVNLMLLEMVKSDMGAFALFPLISPEILQNDERLINWCRHIEKYQNVIKEHLGIETAHHFPKNADGSTKIHNAIELLNRFVGLLGFQFKTSRKVRINGKQVRVYKHDIANLTDDRSAIFKKWRKKWEDKYQNSIDQNEPQTLNEFMLSQTRTEEEPIDEELLTEESINEMREALELIESPDGLADLSRCWPIGAMRIASRQLDIHKRKRISEWLERQVA